MSTTDKEGKNRFRDEFNNLKTSGALLMMRFRLINPMVKKAFFVFQLHRRFRYGIINQAFLGFDRISALGFSGRDCKPVFPK